jgi:lipopolysaccharide/colanic/teichoic acid biosynthesis glycosyltransferase
MQTCLCRALDLICAATGLLLLSPLLAVIACLIKLDSAGPVIFSQSRVGRHFRPFRIHKLRTMVDGAARQGALITADRDPRITRIGAWLRRTKLDETPQLLNVIKGEMSLVGPRPEVAKYVEMFRDQFAPILTVRPGMTDFASLEFYDESELLGLAADPETHYVATILPRKLELARRYVEQRSLRLNVALILRTVVKMGR